MTADSVLLPLREDVRLALHQAANLVEALALHGAAEAEEGGPETMCPQCGHVIEAPDHRMVPKSCPLCNFWDFMVLALRNPEWAPITIRANGQHYSVRPDGQPGGPTMTVRWLDGRALVTTRLRTEGRIPDRYRKALPDNAVVLEGNPDQQPVGRILRVDVG